MALELWLNLLRSFKNENRRLIKQKTDSGMSLFLYVLGLA
jgi:hypothetical protein